MNHEFLAVGMTLIAGLSTGIGGLITYFSRKPNARFLSISLGFSAGVMLYVSMVELFAQSKETLSAALGGSGYPIAAVSYTHLDVYKRQRPHPGQRCRWSR